MEAAFAGWVRQSTALVLRAAVEVGMASEGLYASMRDAGGGFRGRPPAWELVTPAERQVAESLWATGGRILPARNDGAPPSVEIVQRAQTLVEGAVVRHLMNAGRNAVIHAARRERGSGGGYLYVTRGDSRVCSWCAVLASRGPVYSEDSWTDADRKFLENRIVGERGKAKTHDYCRCVVAPVSATGGMEVRARADWLFEQWKKVTYEGKYPNKDNRVALRLWRRFWESEGRGLYSAL